MLQSPDTKRGQAFMEKNRVRSALGNAAALYFIGSAVVAQAQTTLPFTPTMTSGGTALVNQQVLANADGSYTVSGAQQGGGSAGAPVWGLTWDLTLNQDPSIVGSLTLTNLTNITRNFNLAFSLPILSAFSPSIMGGSIDATLFDFNGNGSAALAPIAISPSVYRGTIDGATVLSLFAANIGCAASGPGCTASGSDIFGLPGLTEPGPAVTGAIGMFLNFSLSAGDRVNFLTNFAVEPPAPVPLPASLPLLLLGLGALLRKRRAAI
jgi:hypothetical protein